MDQADKGKKPTQDHYNGIGTFAPVPSTKQPYNHGRSDLDQIKNTWPKEQSDCGDTPGDMLYKFEK